MICDLRLLVFRAFDATIVALSVKIEYCGYFTGWIQVCNVAQTKKCENIETCITIRLSTCDFKRALKKLKRTPFELLKLIPHGSNMKDRRVIDCRTIQSIPQIISLHSLPHIEYVDKLARQSNSFIIIGRRLARCLLLCSSTNPGERDSS